LQFVIESTSFDLEANPFHPELMANATKIKIHDTTFAGKILQEIALSFASECVMVREIIIERVKHEVEQYNQKLPDYFNGLIEPNEAEKTLNGMRMKNKQPIDAEKQVYIALDAFQRNGYFVLIDDVQAEDLDQEVLLTGDMIVSFVKLTPLVGG
jgi:hypothetical protein